MGVRPVCMPTRQADRRRESVQINIWIDRQIEREREID